MIRQLLRDASGANMTEYALLLAFVGIALVGTLQLLTTSLDGVFTSARMGLGS